MALLDITIYGNPILRNDSSDIRTPDESTSALIDDMFETMYRSIGIGLAAPQIGKNINLIVIDPSFGEDEKDAMYLINPEIIEHSNQTIESEEGCLSVPGIRATIPRYEWVKVSYRDLSNNERITEGSGYKSIVLQHEIDHLRGRLFIDYVKGIKKTFILRKLKKDLSLDEKSH